MNPSSRCAGGRGIHLGFTHVIGNSFTSDLIVMLADIGTALHQNKFCGNVIAQSASLGPNLRSVIQSLRIDGGLRCGSDCKKPAVLILCLVLSEHLDTVGGDKYGSLMNFHIRGKNYVIIIHISLLTVGINSNFFPEIRLPGIGTGNTETKTYGTSYCQNLPDI